MRNALAQGRAGFESGNEFESHGRLGLWCCVLGPFSRIGVPHGDVSTGDRDLISSVIRLTSWAPLHFVAPCHYMAPTFLRSPCDLYPC